MPETCKVTKIEDNIFQFSEANDRGPFVDAYLIIGKQRALLVDALQRDTSLFDAVMARTDLPLDVVLTHGHGDHAGDSLRLFHEAGCQLHMDLRDLPVMQEGFGESYPGDWFTDVTPGTRFDLGGLCLEALSVPGHTPGSLVLLERQRQLLFSGDTIGSGRFWMHLPGARPLRLFLQDGLTPFWQQISAMQDLKIYPGHRHQAPGTLSLQYVKEIRAITQQLLTGALVGEEDVVSHRTGEIAVQRVCRGMVTEFLYRQQTLYGPLPDPAREAVKAQFAEHSFRLGKSVCSYRFFEPQTDPGAYYPLVVYLHGAGERGSDTMQVLQNSGAVDFAMPAWQEGHPCYIFAPQCAPEASWAAPEYQALIVAAVAQLKTQYAVDPDRVYLTGLSMGGMGTWQLLATHPELFAAAMPICGAGNPKGLWRARAVPVWAFHGADDPVVPVSGQGNLSLSQTALSGTRDMVAALRGFGSQVVRYTEYAPGYLEKVWQVGAHAAWVPAYADQTALCWLFDQRLHTRYVVDFLMPGVWHIQDAYQDSCYLVEGRERALLIDTGMGGDNIMEVIGGLTRLPVALAVTHCHGDHMYHADRFDKFYLSPKEEAIFQNSMETMMAGRDIRFDNVLPITQGDEIDLGGVVIEVQELCGHTPGSVIFLDRTHNMCFTGDAVGSGSGVWMQLPTSLPLREYRRNLEAFLENLSDIGLDNLTFLGGHRSQAWNSDTGGYNPITKGLIADMITLCDRIMSDDVVPEPCRQPMPYEPTHPILMASYGSATMLYTQLQLEG